MTWFALPLALAAWCALSLPLAVVVGRAFARAEPGRPLPASGAETDAYLVQLALAMADPIVAEREVADAACPPGSPRSEPGALPARATSLARRAGPGDRTTPVHALTWGA